MRVVSLLASTLILATASFGQQSTAPAGASSGRSPSQASTGVDQPPEHPCTPAQVRELLELTGANHLKEQAMRGMMTYMQKSLPPFMPKDVIDDLEASLEKIDLEPMAIESYQKHISTEDATQLIAFYKTPAGKRVVQVLPVITQELQEEGAKQGVKVSREVIERHADEIRAAASKYQQDHAAPPTVTAPN